MIRVIINHDRYAPQYTQEAARSPLIYCWNRLSRAASGRNQGRTWAIRAESGIFRPTLEHT